jgi:hypothetical protein
MEGRTTGRCSWTLAEATSSGRPRRLTPVGPACEIRVTLRASDGQVHARTRLCWTSMPCAAEVLAELTERARNARRKGLRMAIDAAPCEVLGMIRLAGLDSTLGVREHLR